MTLDEAIKWLDPDSRDPKIAELEYADGIETADIVLQKFNEACRTVLKELDYKKQKDV